MTLHIAANKEFGLGSVIRRLSGISHGPEPAVVVLDVTKCRIKDVLRMTENEDGPIEARIEVLPTDTHDSTYVDKENINEIDI